MPEIMLGSPNTTSLYEELIKEYLDDRVLVMNDEIDENVIENYILYILKWNREDRDIPTDKRYPIKMLISSPGGNTFNAMNLIDVILQSKTPIVGIGLDLVASAAYLVYLACHERYAFKHSVFLQHEGEMALENSRSKLKQTAKFFDERENETKEFILSRTTIESQFYDDIYDVEYWMNDKTAKELGVVHKIIGEDCDIDEIL